jgi:hypothetical protein
VDDQEVGVSRVERKPAARLRRVDEEERAVGEGRFPDRGEIGDVAVRRLHGTDGDQRRRGLDGLGQAVQRRCPHPDASALLHEPREQVGGELDLGHEHLRAVGKRGGDQPDELGDGGADGHVLGPSADETGEALAGMRDRLGPAFPARASTAPVLEGALQRGESRCRR